MNKKEFETLAGYELTNEAYTLVESIWLSKECENVLTKQDFLNKYKKVLGEIKLLSEAQERINHTLSFDASAGDAMVHFDSWDTRDKLVFIQLKEIYLAMVKSLFEPISTKYNVELYPGGWFDNTEMFLFEYLPKGWTIVTN